MKWLYNFLRGTIRLLVCGPEPERFLNRCARVHLPFWAVERREDLTLAITLPRRRLAEAHKVAAHCQCALEIERRCGLPFFLWRFRKRYALLLGFVLCVLAMAIGSRFLLVIDIEGNERLSEAEILSVLRQNGVRPGSYGPSIDVRLLENKMLLAMDELSFFSLNRYGIRAEVIVRERSPKPVLVPERQPADIIATATGIITRVQVFEGQARCKVGDTVTEGELLIAGLVDIVEAEYSNADLGSSLHRAQGRVEARTWRTLKAEIQLSAAIKCYTGEEKSRFALNLLGRRMKFYQNAGISFDKYDKITTTKTWTLSDGSQLPFSLEKEQFRQYETQMVELSETAAAKLLESELERDLLARIGESGQVLRRDYLLRHKGEVLELTLLAECSEQIGKTIPLEIGTAEEMDAES